MPSRLVALLSVTLIVCAFVITGCTSSYVTPGGGADLRTALGLSDDDQPSVDFAIAEQLDKRPAASFPATLALLRIQDRGYRSRTSKSIERGNYSIVTVRDVEEDEDLQRLQKMPGVGSIVPLNSMVVGNLNTERDLRAAAARVQADALVLYTFHTSFDVDTTIPAVGVLTLGVFPAEKAKVTSTASAAIIDTRTGFVYALAESTSDTSQLANAWTTQSAVDQSRRRAEREAFEGLLTELESAWGGAVRAHGGGYRPSSPGRTLNTGGDGGGWIREGL